MKNPNGRWAKLTPRLARIVLLMREHRNTRRVADVMEIERENVCTSIRAAEFFVGVKLFNRKQRVKADWDVIDTPDTANAWATIAALEK